MWGYVFISITILMLSILYHHYGAQPTSIIEYPKDYYDFIVVGAGTAGCVIASRLSENPNTSVLLVEAGGYFNWLSSVPLAAPLMQRTSADWSYKTESQFYSSRAFRNHQQFWPRGKGLGGSGQMNYLVHSFGEPKDYRTWPPGWKYKDLKSYFRKVSKTMIFPNLAPDHQLAKAFLLINTTKLSGNVTIERAINTIKRGSRWSTFHAYLQSAWNRKNLHILTDTLVTKILFEDDKSTVDGIKAKFKDGSLGRIGVNKDVIISAGAINTPHLMMVSGLGPMETLREARVPVIRNIPHVGQNLFDHMNLPMYVNLEKPVSITLRKLQSIAEIAKYYVFEKGLLATNGIMGTVTRGNVGILLSGVGTADEHLLKDIANFEMEAFRAFFPSHNDSAREGFLYMVSCLQPRSRGNITLHTHTILDPPRIEPAYLENSWDIDCIQDGVNLAIETLESEKLKKLGAVIHTPDVEGCRHLPQDYKNPAYSECIIRFGALTAYHPAGTCRMGTDENSVVDTELRVNGIKKLRIVDASIIPTPISGTPNSVIISIAERAADLILNIHLDK